MLENAKASRRFAVTSVGLAHATVILYLLGRPWVSMKRQERIGQRVPLFYPDFYFFDYNNSPEFELVWAAQSFAALLATLSNSGYDSLFEVLVMHVCGKFSVLIEQVEKFNHQDDVFDSIACLAKRHHQLSRFDTTHFN